MITILHRGGTAKRLQYYIGRGGSTETPKSDYVIYGWPLMFLSSSHWLFRQMPNHTGCTLRCWDTNSWLPAGARRDPSLKPQNTIDCSDLRPPQPIPLSSSTNPQIQNHIRRNTFVKKRTQLLVKISATTTLQQIKITEKMYVLLCREIICFQQIENPRG